MDQVFRQIESSIAIGITILFTRIRFVFIAATFVFQQIIICCLYVSRSYIYKYDVTSKNMRLLITAG